MHRQRDGSMASFSPPDEQYATTPCWPHLDEILRDGLALLHHALGSNVLAPDEAAGQFSHIVSDLLNSSYHSSHPRWLSSTMLLVNV